MREKERKEDVHTMSSEKEVKAERAAYSLVQSPLLSDRMEP
jgi:hypothetical protein